MIKMSGKELTRVEVMQRRKARRMTKAEAGRVLGISARQVNRLYGAYGIKQGSASAHPCFVPSSN